MIFRIERQDNIDNGNGYGIWVIVLKIRKYRTIKLFTQILGNGDNGERCQ